ncbi:glycosyltransferase family 4 protein [Streptomyces tailanensis]|uniref:glycosyltransferase family 4 protein n=1 Tax=Streptomyces tailanensis TaxID=2569858 RepID=UPI00155A7999|nr:glycosyltransferase family 4 protein [Streptomyces tailanensis]
MRILITAVGQRTEHWIDLFTALTDRPDVEQLTVYASDVSPLTVQGLEGLARHQARFRYRLAPHLMAEGRTGHMASVMFRPGSGRMVRDERPDVVHVIGEAAYLSTQQAVRLRNRYWPEVPLTLYAAQNVVIRFPFPFPLLERRAYRAVSHALPITPSARQVLRDKGYRGPVTIVPLGVDTERFHPMSVRPRRSFTVAFVGRLEPHKGISDLLRAAELADCDALVVGDGSLRGLVEKAATDRRGRVELRKWVDHSELPSILARADVLALPSLPVTQRNLVPWIGIPLREQFGRVLVEAMACGIPVVGSDTGDIPHVVGASGLVFPTGDVAAFADCLKRLRNEPGLAQRLGTAGRSRACEEFGWQVIADTLCRTWRGLIAPVHRLRAPSPRPSSPPGRPTPSAAGSDRGKEETR